MTLEILNSSNVWVDITPYVFYGGIKWQRSDVDAPKSGRNLEGTMMRGRVATKIRLDVTCRPLENSEASLILSLIMPEWVQVRYYDPQVGAVVQKKMYSNNNPASYLMKQKSGRELWSGITFPLIEE